MFVVNELYYFHSCFVPQIHSKYVAVTIGEHLRGLLDDQVICLLQSFIYPKEMMIERPETPVLDDNDQRFTFTQVVPLQQQSVSKHRDPLFELFNPPADAKEGKCACSLGTHAHASDAVFQLTPPDQLEIELRHGLANMVAAVLACPPKSNHLWYHMFAANELNDTYMTGYMVSFIFVSNNCNGNLRIS